ncbi:AAA family ATPase [Candidatus Poribacteria bacterium]|nr:AAA family ATPase [Candidatus Poribacteria bacterium]
MYLQHFGFQAEPFNITPDSRFLFLSHRHKEAMAALLYGIEQRKGFIALTGEIGSGKTTIGRALLKELNKDSIRLALILNPQLSDIELLQAINAEYGLAHESSSRRELLDVLNGYLLREYEAGHNCVLVIDESQRLSPPALEQVRLISNLELETTKLIQIALVGQPELDDLLHLPELEQLNQRIMVRYHIEPLDSEETAAYIEHRIRVASPSTDVRFHKKALRQVFAFSGGIPRKINVVCDRALLATYVAGQLEVSEELARQAVQEVRGKRHRKGRSESEAEMAQPAPEAPAPAGSGGSVPARSGGSKWIAAAILCGFGLVAGAMVANGGIGRRSAADAARRVSPPAALQRASAPTVPKVTPAPSATPLPVESPVVKRTPPPSPTVIPAPSPSRTQRPDPTPTRSPVPTPVPSPSPAATPSAVPATLAPSPPSQGKPSPAPTASPAPAPPPAWHDGEPGGVRVGHAEFSYAASVLTWIAHQGKRLPERELERIRAEDAARVAALELTTGKPPLHLRAATLPASLDAIQPTMYPAILQLDRRSEQLSPWVVLRSRRDGVASVADPLRGELQVPDAAISAHLAGILVPYSDPDGLTGLRPLDSEGGVPKLQECLTSMGLLPEKPTGLYDRATEVAVDRLRERFGQPGGPEIDPLLAMAIRRECP